jgi:hypothetical protein
MCLLSAGYKLLSKPDAEDLRRVVEAAQEAAQAAASRHAKAEAAYQAHVRRGNLLKKFAALMARFSGPQMRRACFAAWRGLVAQSKEAAKKAAAEAPAADDGGGTGRAATPQQQAAAGALARSPTLTRTPKPQAVQMQMLRGLGLL